MSEGNAKMSIMLGKRNEARRKAESKELFRQLMKSPHLVQQSKRHKETRNEQKRKAIDDGY
jgi:hypothetical protein